MSEEVSNHSLVILTAPNPSDPSKPRYLTYYDERWDCRLFLNYKSQGFGDAAYIVEHLSSDLEVEKERIDIRYLGSKKHEKYSVSHGENRVYNHRLCKVTIDKWERSEQDYFIVKGKTYYWMTLNEMAKDLNISKKNMDIVNFVREILINLAIIPKQSLDHALPTTPIIGGTINAGRGWNTNIFDACKVTVPSNKQYNTTDIYTCKAPLYNDKKSKKKEDNNMSFVGLQMDPKTKKVIAFADSKSSRKNEKGEFTIDKTHPYVDKIFTTEKYIAVSYGLNEVSYNSEIMQLEDFMSFFGQNKLDNVFLNIKESIKFIDGSVYFIYAKKKEIGYYHVVEINSEDIFDTKRYLGEHRCCVGGNKTYIQLLGNSPVLQSGSKEEIKTLIQRTVDFCDTLGLYNPVGGEIKVQSWDWE